MIRQTVVYMLSLLAGIASLGCSSSELTETRIETLRIGVLPGEDRNALTTQFMPLLEYLQQEIAVPCELILHDSYEQLQVDFNNKQVDLAWFGGYTFVNANESCGAVALVSRDRDQRFTSYFLVGADDKHDEIADFRGKRFTFGSRLSTSGHLMPRHFLGIWEIDPEAYFGEVRYSGAHDKTVFAVRDGEVDIGVASGTAVERMFADRRLAPGEVRILRETPPFMDYVWACQASIPIDLRTKLRDAFLNLTTANPAHAEILAQLSANYFVPVHSSAFKDLQQIVDRLAHTEATK